MASFGAAETSSCSRLATRNIETLTSSFQDHELMERGVYGIGGFLRISSELRILWSAPYLPRSEHAV